MSTALGYIVALLQAALALLGFAQANPQLPQAQRDQAVQVAQQAITTATNAIASNPQSSVGMQTYANTQYGFQLQYPNTIRTQSGSMEFGKSWWYPFSNGINVFTADYKGDSLVVSVSTDAKYVATCGGSGKARIIGGVNFSYLWGTQDGSASGPYESIYKTKHGGTCYAITILQTEYGNDSWDPLFSIANSFRFVESDSPVSVSGMSKYTDPDFGFSFWYPSGWTVTKKDMSNVPDYSNGEHFVTSLIIAPPGHDPKIFGPNITLTEVNSPARTIISTGHFSSNVFRFDINTHTWMEDRNSYDYGSATTTKTADVSNNTMGGLHLFLGFNEPELIVPLSAQHFLSIGASGAAPTIDGMPFVKTIVATDPSVATPVSAAEQIKVIQAEKDAYAGQ